MRHPPSARAGLLTGGSGLGRLGRKRAQARLSSAATRRRGGALRQCGDARVARRAGGRARGVGLQHSAGEMSSVKNFPAKKVDSGYNTREIVTLDVDDEEEEPSLRRKSTLPSSSRQTTLPSSSRRDAKEETKREAAEAARRQQREVTAELDAVDDDLYQAVCMAAPKPVEVGLLRYEAYIRLKEEGVDLLQQCREAASRKAKLDAEMKRDRISSLDSSGLAKELLASERGGVAARPTLISGSRGRDTLKRPMDMPPNETARSKRPTLGGDREVAIEDAVGRDAGKLACHLSTAPDTHVLQEGESDVEQSRAPALAQKHKKLEQMAVLGLGAKAPAAADVLESAPSPSGDRRSRRHDSSDSSSTESVLNTSFQLALPDTAGVDEVGGVAESKARDEGEGKVVVASGVRAKRAAHVDLADEFGEAQTADTHSPVADIAPRAYPYVRGAAADFKFKVITAPQTLNDVDDSCSQPIWNVIKAKHFGVTRNHIVGLVEQWETAMVVVGAFTSREEAVRVRNAYAKALKRNPMDENEGDGMDEATGLPVDFFVMPTRLYTHGAGGARGRSTGSSSNNTQDKMGD